MPARRCRPRPRSGRRRSAFARRRGPGTSGPAAPRCRRAGAAATPSSWTARIRPGRGADAADLLDREADGQQVAAEAAVAPGNGRPRMSWLARSSLMSYGNSAVRSISAARGATCSSARTRTASRRSDLLVGEAVSTRGLGAVGWSPRPSYAAGARRSVGHAVGARSPSGGGAVAVQEQRSGDRDAGIRVMARRTGSRARWRLQSARTDMDQTAHPDPDRGRVVGLTRPWPSCASASRRARAGEPVRRLDRGPERCPTCGSATWTDATALAASGSCPR